MPNIGPYIGFALGVIAALGLVWVAFGLGTKPTHLNLLMLITGALIGWIVGILITPAPNEVVQFTEFSRALSTFVGGYLIAKVDKLFETSVNVPGNVNELSIGRVALFASGFALGALTTFIWRAYVATPS